MSSAADKPEHVRAFSLSLSSFFRSRRFHFQPATSAQHRAEDGATITHFSADDGENKHNYR